MKNLKLCALLLLMPLAALAQPAEPIVAPTDMEGIAAPDRPTPPDVPLTPTEETKIEDAVAVEVKEQVSEGIKEEVATEVQAQVTEGIEAEVAEVVTPAAEAVSANAIALLLATLGALMVAIWISAGKLGDMFHADSRIVALVLGVVGSLVLFLLGLLPMLPSDWKGAVACVFFGMLAATNGGMSSQTGRTPTGNAGNLGGA